METSKKIALILFVVLLPYVLFVVYIFFVLGLSYYAIVFVAIFFVAIFFVIRKEVLSFSLLLSFAKALREARWSYRVSGLENSVFKELGDAFNMAADMFEKKQNELRQIIDIVPGFIYAKDQNGDILLANKTFANFLGCLPQEIVGKNEADFDITAFFGNDRYAKVFQDDDRVQSISEEECVVGDKTFTYLVFRSPLFDNNGNKVAMLLFAYDITDLKEIQDNLYALNSSLEARVAAEVEKNIEKDKELIREKEKFIRNAVHEINTALTVITLNAEYLIKDYGVSRSTSAILGAAKSLSSAYGDLSYSTIKDSPTFQKESSVDVSELLVERVEFFRDIAGLSDIALVSQIKPGAVFVLNKAKLTRLIDNNLSNAIKYSHPQKTIFIRFTCDKGKWILEFESIGKKIENKERIFTLFAREDGIKGGHGIGLSIVKEICDEYDIAIEVETDDNRNIFRYCFNKNC